MDRGRVGMRSSRVWVKMKEDLEMVGKLRLFFASSSSLAQFGSHLPPGFFMSAGPGSLTPHRLLRLCDMLFPPAPPPTAGPLRVGQRQSQDAAHGLRPYPDLTSRFHPTSTTTRAKNKGSSSICAEGGGGWGLGERLKGICGLRVKVGSIIGGVAATSRKGRSVPVAGGRAEVGTEKREVWDYH